ncbi:MAG: RNA polymerase factor sigma-54 [Planctomycetes bacterium]|nr:RNA polymerase factor sigma-54 [Planctomycetota bacterium]
MRMELGQYQRLEQRMILAPQMIMSMEVLQLATMDLKGLIEQNLVENPVLELQDSDNPPETVSPTEAGPLAGAAPAVEARDDAAARDAEFEKLAGIETAWREYFSETRPERFDDSGKDRKLEAMQNTASRAQSLQDYLYGQFRLLEMEGKLREIGEQLIYNIDDNGYLKYPVDEVLDQLNRERSEPGEAQGGNGTGTRAASEPQGAAGPGGNGAALAEGAGAEPEEGAPPLPFMSREPLAFGWDLSLPMAVGGDGAGPSEAEVTEVEDEVDELDTWPEDGRHYSLRDGGRALKLIQQLDPPGVGARNLQECLLLQIGRRNPRYRLERQLIENHLHDIEQNKIPKICKATAETLEIVQEAIAFIRHLNPRPGALYSNNEVMYVVPDVVVEEIDGRYEVRLENAYIPRIQISSHYRRMLLEEKGNPKIYEYVKKKIESAKWLIESIEQRQNTLFRIAREIVEYQRDFLDHGLGFLRPLKMQQIADRVGIHVSTVSRAVADKYMQTPRGIFAMKFFFTGGTINAEGEMEATIAVKERIREMLGNENRKAPLSDDEIADKLKGLGLNIARRTVTKYRRQLGIAASRQRREF